MATETIWEFRRRMEKEDTERLKNIWNTEFRNEWTDEQMEVVGQLLQKRLGKAPPPASVGGDLNPNQGQTIYANALTLGKEVYSRGIVAPEMAPKSALVKDEFKHQIERRQIPGVTVREGVISSRTYIFVQQNVGFGANVTSAVRIEPFGVVDLEIEHRHYESTKVGCLGTLAKYYISLGFIGAGILTLALMGAGVILIIIGIVIWPRGLRGDLNKGQDQKSSLLREVVKMSIDEAVKNVSAQ